MDNLTSKTEVEPLRVRLNLACVGACDCLVKTPVIHYHNPTCKYRVLQEAANALVEIDECYDAFSIGAKARTPSTLLANVQNASRRSACLSAVENEFFTEVMEDGEDADEYCDLSWGAEPEQYVEQFRAALAKRAAVEPSTLRPGLERAIEILSKADCYTAHGARDSGLAFADISTEHVKAFRDHMIDKLDEAIGAAVPPSALPPKVAEVLCNAAQLMDGWKVTAPQDWTEWDQSVRDSIATLQATKPTQTDLAKVVDHRRSEPPTAHPDTVRLDFLESQRKWGDCFAVMDLDSGDVYVRPWKIDNQSHGKFAARLVATTMRDVIDAELAALTKEACHECGGDKISRETKEAFDAKKPCASCSPDETEACPSCRSRLSVSYPWDEALGRQMQQKRCANCGWLGPRNERTKEG